MLHSQITEIIINVKLKKKKFYYYILYFLKYYMKIFLKINKNYKSTKKWLKLKSKCKYGKKKPTPALPLSTNVSFKASNILKPKKWIQYSMIKGTV